MIATRKVLRECDKLVTVSADLARVAKKLEPQVKPNINVVYNGCDLDNFQPVENEQKLLLRKQLGLPEKKVILFLLGAIEENKGIFELLDVYAELRRKWNGKICLVMIGSGKDEKAFLSRIDELGLRDSIHLTGFVPHDEVPDWVKAGDIMIFPTHYEGVPNAVLETMACSKPVVATSVGGIPEIIRDGETGFLVKKNDVKGIVKVVNDLIEDEDLRKRIGNSALEFLRNHASWSGNAEKMIGIYHEVINTYKNKLSDADERRLSGF
jgi:glycosyltransferase involved in cell wall biosynthesis